LSCSLASLLSKLHVSPYLEVRVWLGEHYCSYLNGKESSLQVVHKGLLLCPNQARKNEDKELEGSHIKDRRRLLRNGECVSMCFWQAEWKSPHAEALSWLECLEKEQSERRSLKHLERLFLWIAGPPSPFLVKHRTTNDQNCIIHVSLWFTFVIYLKHTQNIVYFYNSILYIHCSKCKTVEFERHGNDPIAQLDSKKRIYGCSCPSFSCLIFFGRTAQLTFNLLHNTSNFLTLTHISV